MFSFAWLSFSYTSPASPHSSAAYKAAVVSRGRLIPATWVHGVVQFVLSQLMCQFVHVGLSGDYWFSFNRPDLLSSLLLVLLLIKQVIANPTFFVFFFCLWCLPSWYHLTHHFESFPSVPHVLYSAFKATHHLPSISIPSNCFISPLSLSLPSLLPPCSNNNHKMFEMVSM